MLLEIIRHRLNNINDDAASTLKRVSGSQIAVEASDLNTVIMAADGRVVACGRYVLIQVASMHLVVSFLLEHYADNPGIAPGDQFITNDPYVGTLHQPDVVLAAPIFVDGTLVAWCASVVHQSDVGGPTPGGITYDARSIFDEAIPMAPIKIVEGGIRAQRHRARVPDPVTDAGAQRPRPGRADRRQPARRHARSSRSAGATAPPPSRRRWPNSWRPASANYASVCAPCPTAVGATPPTSCFHDRNAPAGPAGPQLRRPPHHDQAR